MANPISTTPENADPVAPGTSRMKFRLQVVAVSDAGQEQVYEVASSPCGRYLERWNGRALTTFPYVASSRMIV